MGVSWRRWVAEEGGRMPTRNVNLTEELDRFVGEKLASGRYENASEVVRAGLRLLEREEREYEAKLAALRAAIDEGDASGIAEGFSFEQLMDGLGLGSDEGETGRLSSSTSGAKNATRTGRFGLRPDRNSSLRG